MSGVEFHPQAEEEFAAAVAYYEAQSEGLGLGFIEEVARACRRISEFPRGGRPFGRRLRRFLLPRFPYGLLYRAEGERIRIVAVAHLHRRPGYWRERLQP